METSLHRTPIEIRTATEQDLPKVAEFLETYMQEAFKRSWDGSVEKLERDGLGREFAIKLAVTAYGIVVAFAAWIRSYDLHHCIPGATIVDMYVLPDYRCRGVAVALVCAAAAEALRQGGRFIKGSAAQRLYSRLAMCFPGADCIVGGRAFRALAAFDGKPTRDALRNAPPKEWNFEE